MGKPKRQKKHRKTEEGKWDETPRRCFENIVRENANFDKYYKIQKICPEEEWDTFLTAMKENLPATFRITGSKGEAKALLKVVKSEFFTDVLNPTQTKESNGATEPVEDETEADKLHPVALPWYPDNLAWQLKLTRKDIRRSELYFRLHNFLISETNSGNISRQEAVSMIPPLLLDIQPHHKILDMCAAPGSKTSQLIELLHSEENKLPSGFVIANDIDNNRCYMLVHQAKRLNSPCIVITNHDSTVMPNFFTNSDGKRSIVKFDRVLCDVPCSGDGTLRKNPDIWLKWNAANGNNLHGIQCRILRRGLEMLTIGGRVVYSTCSLNPIEDEAVVYRLIKESEGAIQLVDVSSKLPGLKYNKGMSHWLPASRDVEGYEKFEDVPEKWHTQVRPQMFPPPKEEAEKFLLDRCIRVLPHHQDTGGFFVAVLEKVRLLPWEAEKKETAEAEKEMTVADGSGDKAVEKSKEVKEPQRKRRKIQGYKEDPFVFFDEKEELWPLIKNFYDINEDLEPTCLLTRCKEGKKKNIYFTSPAVKEIVFNNADRIKIINTGVKAFVRCHNSGMECAFRLAQEGLYSIIQYIGPKRRIPITKCDLIHLLSCENPRQPPEITTLSEKCQERLNSITQGSCVLTYEEEDRGDGEPTLTLHVVGWRGKCSARAYVALADCIHYLRLLGVDVSKYDVNKFQNKRTADEEKAENNVEEENTERTCDSVEENSESIAEEVKLEDEEMEAT